MSFRVGIDSGGTFTDVVLFDENTGRIQITKTPSTPQNPSIGVYTGLEKIVRQADVTTDQIASLIHGTTVATNALLEYKGVPTALVATRGFKDILSIVRQERPNLYDYFMRRPEPLIPRHLRFEVGERTLYNGEILESLNDAEVVEIIGRIREKGISTVAVCLLHAYANPTHEKRIKELFGAHHPEASVSLSSEILPEIREYERTSTTCINAYVMPIIERYIADLRQRVRQAGLQVDLNVMQSNGGIMTARSAGQKSVATILSGPAGGVIGSQGLSALAGIENLITLDMGGTSCDVCLINKGQFLTTKESEIGGHAIKVPMIDINTIGAGGGSIAWIDSGGLLRVGPHSSGADPGPACYGRGGQEPTVTDANLVLGRLNPAYYVGGEMALDDAAARSAIAEKVAAPLGLSVESAAEGIIRVVNANMIRGVRRVSVERGHDPRRFALFCFGGGGPLHGVEMAAELKIPQVIIPIHPGVNSAVGLLMANFRYDYSTTCLRTLSDVNLDELHESYRSLETQAVAEMRAEKIPEEKISIQRSVDMRYYGQGYEVEVPLAAGALTAGAIDELKTRFNALHRQMYGYDQPEEEMELVYLRVAAVGGVAKPQFRRERHASRDARQAVKGTRRVYLDGAYRDLPIYDRGLLKSGNRFDGPAIVEQFDSTTYIKAGQTVGVDDFMNLFIDLAGSGPHVKRD